MSGRRSSFSSHSFFSFTSRSRTPSRRCKGKDPGRVPERRMERSEAEAAAATEEATTNINNNSIRATPESTGSNKEFESDTKVPTDDGGKTEESLEEEKENLNVFGGQSDIGLEEKKMDSILRKENDDQVVQVRKIESAVNMEKVCSAVEVEKMKAKVEAAAKVEKMEEVEAAAEVEKIEEKVEAAAKEEKIEEKVDPAAKEEKMDCTSNEEVSNQVPEVLQNPAAKKKGKKQGHLGSREGWLGLEDKDFTNPSDGDECPGPSGRGGGRHLAAHYSSSEMAEKMKSVFKSGLDILLDKREMFACRAIVTELFPHQRAALAWMFDHENKVSQGMCGGILADDMGLGKTLTVISLILTNHWDSMPLCKPELGFVRESFLDLKWNKKKAKKAPILTAKQLGVGAKIGNDGKRKAAGGIFDKIKKLEKRDSSSDYDSDDEFQPKAKAFSFGVQRKRATREERDSDFINDDSETDPATDSEDESFDPKLNVDGNLDASSSEDEEVIPRLSKRKVIESFSSVDGDPDDVEDRAAKRSKIFSDSKDNDGDVGLPSPEKKVNPLPESLLASLVGEPSKPTAPAPVTRALQHPPEPQVFPIRPPKLPAQRRGRRRPTLIVCPTSLIGHWIEQLDRHLHEGVGLELRLHHGTSRAARGEELENYDIVITSYGTLAAEYGVQGHSPLLGAKWLRVVLDEGHFIKNHRSKTTKAALQLQTLRRWVVTGTPIQNNLIEFWSQINWLDFGMYAGYLAHFKHDIVNPCKNGDPVGFERLQIVIDAVCLRRTKYDKTKDGRPLVPLPSKTIHQRTVQLNKEERKVYDVIYNDARMVVSKLNRRGELLGNYVFIFALMMRMRQLCCHMELLENAGFDFEEILRGEEGQDEDNLGETEKTEKEKKLMKQLRTMIKSGVTEDCSICLDDLKSPVITPCGHVYCRDCIEGYCTDKPEPKCPLCRQPIDVGKLLEAGPEQDEEGEVAAGETVNMDDIVVKVSSSKVNAVLEDMLRIRRDHPEDSMIVVSQFTSFLSVIQPLLRLHDFRYTRLDGSMSHPERADVIKVFQGSGKNRPKVLLLSLKAGGVGLNLTAANHLFLLDPAWNPASEWQCFDRIHRMGQTKDVNIYKYITENSIEEEMVAIQEKKKTLINGAFHMPEDERRRSRIQDIKKIFKI